MFVLSSWLVHNLLILLSVAFFTLFERNVIGLFHLRLGPNNVSFTGILQPLLDAFKLLIKQDLYPLRSNVVYYSLSPFIALCLSLLVWTALPIAYSLNSLNYSLLLFFVVSSFIVFPVLMSGWSSNSNYSLIGSLRSIAQSVSYESVFSTLLVILCFSIISFSSQSLISSSSLFLSVLFPLWVVCTLAETHRAPFDFSESESELVSGFNTEYSGCYFAFIFLSEYSVLLFSCFLISYLFLGWVPLFISSFILVIVSLCFSFFFVWVRITFCRFRYDFLIMLAWNFALPTSLMLLCFFLLV